MRITKKTKDTATNALESVVKSPLFGTVIIALIAGPPILRALGLMPGRQTLEEKKRYESTANAIKFAFNPEFWKTIPKGALYYGEESALKKAKRIWDAKGWLNDDEDALYKVFNEMPSLSAISSVAYWFENKYNRNLWDYIMSFTNSK